MTGVCEFVSLMGQRAGGAALFEWMHDTLVATGWLRLQNPHAPYFDLTEPGAGKVTVPLLGERTREQDRAILEISTAALRALLRTLMAIRDRRAGRNFLQNARLAGHVQQVGTTWRPVLREGEQLSNWLLAIVASDMLGSPGHLSVCDHCGRVWMDQSSSDLCPRHRRSPGLRPMLEFVRGGELPGSGSDVV